MGVIQGSLVETSATLVVTGALLVVTRFAIRNQQFQQEFPVPLTSLLFHFSELDHTNQHWELGGHVALSPP